MDELRNQINAVREEHVVGTSYISKAWTRASGRYWYANSEINHSLVGTSKRLSTDYLRQPVTESQLPAV